ncbi:MAG: hypothetical protein FIB01_04470, partial [Gemmatimonadetes bacterium]|nr:hypothetical protein [Gemmatimonadota bacterium]
MKRRDFLVQGAALAAAGALPRLGQAWVTAAGPAPGASGIALICDPRDPIASAPPARWALGTLQQALTARGIPTRVLPAPGDATPEERLIVSAGAPGALGRGSGVRLPTSPEALAIAGGALGEREAVFALGSDVRGLLYATTELADLAASGLDPSEPAAFPKPVVQAPANRVRSVLRQFASDVEDKPWFNDRAFWPAYFGMLAAQRFNRVNLTFGLGYDFAQQLKDTYFYFTYPFLVKVPGYDVRATGLPDAERDRNLELLRFISDEAAAKGLEFQLGLWTHAYVWQDSPAVNYVIEGLTPQTHAPYCRDALSLVLRECPNITGVTLRIHGESGVPERSWELWRTIFGGVKVGRPVSLDLHAKGIDQETLDAALSIGVPVSVSPKFWAEHMGLPYHQADIRPNEIPPDRPVQGLMARSAGDRSFTRYGYADLLREDRPYDVLYRIWPGTQRVLLWSDPAFAAAYGRAGSFGGGMGIEIMEPL